MPKLICLLLIGWSTLFVFRVIQIGGLDPTYKDSEVEVFKIWRDNLGGLASEIIPYPQSALLSGIILGNKENLPRGLRLDLQTTSTIHMVVVSGQNLTILAGFIMSLAGLLGRRKTISLTIFIIIFYSLLTGFAIPVARALIMAFLASLAQLLGREYLGGWALALTGAVMLLYNPNQLLSISFQLSFLATFGVVIVAPIIINHLKKLPEIIRQDLGVTLAAQLLVLPVIIYNFGQLSLIGVLANLFVMWTIPLVMVFGPVALFAGSVSTLLGQVIGMFSGILLTYFIYMVEFFAKIPGASLMVGESSWWMWAGYYLMLGGIMMALVKVRK